MSQRLRVLMRLHHMFKYVHLYVVVSPSLSILVFLEFVVSLYLLCCIYVGVHIHAP